MPSAWVADQPSQWPHDLFRHVLQGPANARPVPTAQIDLVQLQAWATYNFAQGFKYNKPISQARSVFDTLAEIAAAGRAVMVFKDGKWSVAFDEQIDIDHPDVFAAQFARFPGQPQLHRTAARLAHHLRQRR